MSNLTLNVRAQLRLRTRAFIVDHVIVEHWPSIVGHITPNVEELQPSSMSNNQCSAAIGP
eukprot:11180007-Lingulodinium_polyedra.AAC.1